MKSTIVPVINKYNIKQKPIIMLPISLVIAIFAYSFSSSLFETCKILYKANTTAKIIPDVCFSSIVLPCN